MTPAQQKKATWLLTQALRARDLMDAGQGIDADEDARLTHDIRMLLIQVGTIPDRRKKKGARA